MSPNFYLWLLSASLLATVKYCDAILHGVGPLNITRKMGEENVHIDCPFSTTNAPFWRINNSQYGPSSLPSLVNPTVFGITITTVNDALNQTTFQCLTPSGTGSDVLVSEVGMLTVTESVIYNPPRSTGRIFLDHQRLRFNDTHMTIAWRFENNGCCAAPVTYKIWKTTCGMSSLTLLDTTEDVDYTILSSVADESVYFLISAICTIECGRSFYFQVHSNVITGNIIVNFPEGQQGCINVAEVKSALPSPTSTLYIVWPGNDGVDCICPLCNDVITQCFLSSCHCYNSSFAPQLISIESDSSRLCWPSSFSNHNGTDIYFYTEDRGCSNVPNVRGPLLTQTYIYTARFLQRGPPLKPTLIFNQSASPPTVCYDAYSYYDISSYEINITDFVNDHLVNRKTVNVSKGCIALPEVQYPPQCSPYQISIKAFNRIGASPVATTDADLRFLSGRNYCLCLNKKLHASASIQELTTTTAQLQVTCTKLMQSSQISNIEVRNVGTGYQNQVSCDGLPVQIQYANLQQNTHYNVTMTASSITPSTCGITSFTTLLSPPPLPTIQYSNVPPQVCFNACCNYDIEYYVYSISDSTHDVLVQDQTTTTGCVPMPRELFPSQCSPYNVNVKAYNRVDVSDAVSKEVPTEDSGGDSCGCLEQKIDVHPIVNDITATTATLHATCTKLLYSSQIDSISITVLGYSHYHVQCNGELFSTLCYPLLPSKQYAISFRALMDQSCLVKSFTTHALPHSSTRTSSAPIFIIIISLSVCFLLLEQ